MNLTVNGEPRGFTGVGLVDLLAELQVNPRNVVVEKNGEIVPRNSYAACALADGDVLEIIRFVGGG